MINLHIKGLAGRLRSMARYEHDDLSIGAEAADALEAAEAKVAELERELDELTDSTEFWLVQYGTIKAEMERERDKAIRQRDSWFDCHIAHQQANNSLGKANRELFKRAYEAEHRADAAESALAEAVEVVKLLDSELAALEFGRPERARAFLERHAKQSSADLLRQSAAAYNAMSPEQKAAMHEAQRQSWVRGMAPCEHGVSDWETCPKCRAKAGDPVQGPFVADDLPKGGKK